MEEPPGERRTGQAPRWPRQLASAPARCSVSGARTGSSRIGSDSSNCPTTPPSSRIQSGGYSRAKRWFAASFGSGGFNDPDIASRHRASRAVRLVPKSAGANIKPFLVGPPSKLEHQTHSKDSGTHFPWARRPSELPGLNPRRTFCLSQRTSSARPRHPVGGSGRVFPSFLGSARVRSWRNPRSGYVRSLVFSARTNLILKARSGVELSLSARRRAMTAIGAKQTYAVTPGTSALGAPRVRDAEKAWRMSTKVWPRSRTRVDSNDSLSTSGEHRLTSTGRVPT